MRSIRAKAHNWYDLPGCTNQNRSNTPPMSVRKAQSCSNMADSGNTGHVGATTSSRHLYMSLEHNKQETLTFSRHWQCRLTQPGHRQSLYSSQTTRCHDPEQDSTVHSPMKMSSKHLSATLKTYTLTRAAFTPTNEINFHDGRRAATIH